MRLEMFRKLWMKELQLYAKHSQGAFKARRQTQILYDNVEEDVWNRDIKMQQEWLQELAWMRKENGRSTLC